MTRSKLTTPQMVELYEGGKTLEEIAAQAGIGSVAVWKRLNQTGVIMRPAHTRRGNHWSIKKRGAEFLGSDGRVWVRGIKSTKRRNSTRRARVVAEEGFGGPIPKGVIVHHKDQISTNDLPENLVIVPKSIHTPINHRKGLI